MQNSHTPNQEPYSDKTNGEKFKNVCQGIAAIGTMALPYLLLFLNYFQG